MNLRVILLGAEFVSQKKVGAEFVWWPLSWCRVGAEFAWCQDCEVPRLQVPSLQGAEGIPLNQAYFISCYNVSAS